MKGLMASFTGSVQARLRPALDCLVQGWIGHQDRDPVGCYKISTTGLVLNTPSG